MKDEKRKPDEDIWALVSGAGEVVTREGLVAVILVERIKRAEVPGKGEPHFNATVYGEPALVLLKDQKADNWHITGPVDGFSKTELAKLAELFRIWVDNRPDDKLLSSP